MKKTMKSLIGITLVLVMTLSLFSGCGPKTDQEFLTQEFGMTFDSATYTYDGTAKSIEVSVDSAIAGDKEYTVEYAYEKGGEAISASAVVGAGTYSVQAQISTGDEGKYFLDSEIVIEKAKVSFEVGDLYVREGSNPETAISYFAGTKLAGSDTVSSIGLEWDIADINKIDEMDKLSQGKAIGVKITKSENYEAEVSKGKLYVLGYNEYSAVGPLQIDIKNVAEYNAKFNELTLAENNIYVGAAQRVLLAFADSANYNEIQMQMLGSIDKETTSTNLPIAEKRSLQGYSLSSDVDGDASIIAPTAEELLSILKSHGAIPDADTWETEMTVSPEDKDDDLLSELKYYNDDEGFMIDYSARTKEETYEDYEDKVRVGDTFYFVFRLADADVDGYTVDSISFRNSTVKFETGAPYKENGKTFYVFQDRVDSTMIGMLGSSAKIEATVNVVPQYKASFDGDMVSTNNANIASLTISEGYTDVLKYSKSTDSETTKTSSALVVGKTYKLRYVAENGYALKSISLGDFDLDAEDFTDGMYEFTVEEDMFDVEAGGTFMIQVETSKRYDIEIYINDRLVRASGETYEGANGDAIVQTLRKENTVGYILEEDELDITLVPDTNYVITSVSIESKNDYDITPGSGTADTVNLIEEVSKDGRLNLDFTSNNGLFDLNTSETVLKLNIYFQPKYSFDVSSDQGSFSVNSSGEYVSSKLGSVSVENYEGDTISEIAKGQYYMLNVEVESGYYISSIKINDRTWFTAPAKAATTNNDATSAQVLSDYAQMMIANQSSYFVEKITAGGTTKYIANPIFNSENIQESYLIATPTSGISAGGTIDIEIEYDTYYEVATDGGLGDVKLGFSTKSSSVNTKLYTTSNKSIYYVFGSDDGSSISVTFEFQDNWVGLNDNNGVDRITYYLFLNKNEKEEDDFYIKPTNSTTAMAKPSDKTFSIGIDDLIKGISVGKEAYISSDCDYDYED